jgi:hypothetical protein
MRTVSTFFALALISGSVSYSGAQETYERVLLPVTTMTAIPGAFGSSWITDSWIRNEATTSVKVFGFDRDCLLPECPVDEVAPIGSGVTIHARIGAPPGFLGAFLFVEKQNSARIAFGLRFRDISRQSQTWGTEIPVVREADFRSDRVSLLDVPVTPGFRQVLRIYELDGLQEREVLVRVRTYRLDPNNTTPDRQPSPDPLLGDAIVRLAFVPETFARRFYPAYLAISDLSTIAPLGDAQRIALIVEPVTPGLRIWAFATVVNNETQHATVITPQ